MSVSKKFAVFDIDGTIFRSSLFLEVLEECIDQGLFPKSSRSIYEKEKAAWLTRKKSDAYDTYIEAAVTAFMTALPEVKESDFNKVANAVIERLHQYTYVYTTKLIDKYKKEGRFLIAISGSPEILVELFSKKYKFDYYHASRYHTKNGLFTGTAQKAHTRKDTILSGIVEKFSLDQKDSVAIGDSNGDLDLLKSVDNPVAFNPDQKLFKSAEKHGWRIVLERKNMIYEMESHNGSYILAKAER